MRIAVAGASGVVGYHVMRVAEHQGHSVLPLARAYGVDLVAGTGLDLTGVDAVIDVSGSTTTSSAKSRAFFREATTNLLRAGMQASVRHHIALSIVGAAAAPHGYYAGKALQEELVLASDAPSTVLRTTQFYEFAEQNAVAFGSLRVLPKMRSQPIAAATVADRLVELADHEPTNAVTELAGPAEVSMAQVLRSAYASHGQQHRVLEISLPGGFGRALRDGSILPGTDVETCGPTLDEWILSDAR